MTKTADKKQVQIGDRMVKIEGITGWKFLEASEIVASILEQLPELYTAMEEFTQHRMESQAKVYPRAAAMALWPDQLADLPDEYWAAQNNEVRMPGERPSIQEQAMQVFPQALRKARPLVMRLMAVLAVPSGELEQAAQAGGTGVEDTVAQWESHLLYAGRMGDLVKLVAMAIDAFKAEATEDPEVAELLGKLPALLLGATEAEGTSSESTASTLTPEEQERRAAEEADRMLAEAREDSEQAAADALSEKPGNPTSSSGSQTPSDGSHGSPSTESAGGPSGDLATASTSVR